jgi:hypothetical protein
MKDFTALRAADELAFSNFEALMKDAGRNMLDILEASSYALNGGFIDHARYFKIKGRSPYATLEIITIGVPRATIDDRPWITVNGGVYDWNGAVDAIKDWYALAATADGSADADAADGSEVGR